MIFHRHRLATQDLETLLNIASMLLCLLLKQFYNLYNLSLLDKYAQLLYALF